MAEARYPQWFGDTPEAIPLSVRIGQQFDETPGEYMGPILMGGSLFLIAGILPLPVWDTLELTVRVGVEWAGGDVGSGVVSLTRTDAVWFSFLSPLGLLPVPGPSDRPRVYSAPWTSATSDAASGALTAESIVDAIVKGLETIDWSRLPPEHVAKRDGRLVWTGPAVALTDAGVSETTPAAPAVPPAPAPAVRLPQRPAAPSTPSVPIRIAVWQLTPQTGLDAQLMAPLTDSVRDTLVNSGRFVVLARGEMEKIMKEQQIALSTACDTTDCAVEYGQIMSVEKIVVGTVARVGGTYQVVLRLVDVASGHEERSGKAAKAGAEDVLLELAEQAVAKLLP